MSDMLSDRVGFGITHAKIPILASTFHVSNGLVWQTYLVSLTKTKDLVNYGTLLLIATM
jgi:hypothetical protein